jgi:hypothetical protein
VIVGRGEYEIRVAGRGRAAIALPDGPADGVNLCARIALRRLRPAGPFEGPVRLEREFSVAGELRNILR